MYKDYKKSESLDTGFVGGSGILWMFSGIVLGLLVGLGMYYFSNNANSTFSTVSNVQQSIEAVQKNIPSQISQPSNILKQATKSQNTHDKTPEKRLNKFSYYAVLPTLDVPVGSEEPIETRPFPVNNSKELKALQKKVALLNGAVETGDETAAVRSGDFLLQVASFRKKSKATLTKGRLAKRGVDAYIKKRKIKGRMWYRVVAGPVDQNSIDNWKQQAEKLGHRPLVISVR